MPSGADLQKKFASRSTLAGYSQIYSQSSPIQRSGRNGEVRSDSRCSRFMRILRIGAEVLKHEQVERLVLRFSPRALIPCKNLPIDNIHQDRWSTTQAQNRPKKYDQNDDIHSISHRLHTIRLQSTLGVPEYKGH